VQQDAGKDQPAAQGSRRGQLLAEHEGADQDDRNQFAIGDDRIGGGPKRGVLEDCAIAATALGPSARKASDGQPGARRRLPRSSPGTTQTRGGVATLTQPGSDRSWPC
jgi:hypothetical protein